MPRMKSKNSVYKLWSLNRMTKKTRSILPKRLSWLRGMSRRPRSPRLGSRPGLSNLCKSWAISQRWDSRYLLMWELSQRSLHLSTGQGLITFQIKPDCCQIVTKVFSAQITFLLTRHFQVTISHRVNHLRIILLISRKIRSFRPWDCRKRRNTTKQLSMT